VQIVENVTPWQGTHGSPIARPNYILQDDDDDQQQHRYNARSRTTSIIQEVMLTCMDISKPTFEILATKLATPKFPVIWFCKMANSVLSKQGELLEYHHLIANPKTWAAWTHSLGNRLRWLLDILRMPTMENSEFARRGHYCYIRHAFWHTRGDCNNLLPQDQQCVYIPYIHGTVQV
jgi:hypothetical protein